HPAALEGGPAAAPARQGRGEARRRARRPLPAPLARASRGRTRGARRHRQAHGAALRRPRRARATQGEGMTAYTLREICQILEIDEDFGFELEREAIISVDEPADAPGRYSALMLERARVAYHLVHDLDVKFRGGAVMGGLGEERRGVRGGVGGRGGGRERRRGWGRRPRPLWGPPRRARASRAARTT